jgi:ssDNA-binding Zn-finger/Zn-ribbon topoisomerase 1
MFALILLIVIAVLAVVVLAAVLRKQRPARSAAKYPYQQVSAFLSEAELSFFGVLRQGVGDRGIVFAKVRIADVLETRRGLDNSERQTALNKIVSKHFDFVICANDSAKPLAAVELDDSSHQRKKQIARDKFVNCAARAASLPLIRVPAKNAYSIAQLREQLSAHLPPGVDVALDPDDTEPAPAGKRPACPKCDLDMVRRQGKSGALAGKAFWGCQHYPKCRSVLPIDAGLGA